MVSVSSSGLMLVIFSMVSGACSVRVSGRSTLAPAKSMTVALLGATSPVHSIGVLPLLMVRTWKGPVPSDWLMALIASFSVA